MYFYCSNICALVQEEKQTRGVCEIVVEQTCVRLAAVKTDPGTTPSSSRVVRANSVVPVAMAVDPARRRRRTAIATTVAVSIVSLTQTHERAQAYDRARTYTPRHTVHNTRIHTRAARPQTTPTRHRRQRRRPLALRRRRAVMCAARICSRTLHERTRTKRITWDKNSMVVHECRRRTL